MRYVKIIGVIIVLGILLIYYNFIYKIDPLFVDIDPELSITAERISDEPIIYQGLDTLLSQDSIKYGYTNINGPSLLKVPDWVSNPLGKYYLYFAHHKGEQIRMAYSDSITGPYRLYHRPVLELSKSTMALTPGVPSGFSDLRKYTQWTETRAMMVLGRATQKTYEDKLGDHGGEKRFTQPHIASPDVRELTNTRKLQMTFHGVVEGSLQMTKRAISENGLSFKAKKEVLGLPYMRSWFFNQREFAIGMPGVLYKEMDGELRPRNRWLFDTRVRHSAVLVVDSTLLICYSQVGDSPERILCSTVDVSDKWSTWKASESFTVISPELPWEGGSLNATFSVRGEVEEQVRELRDPYLYEEDGQIYLLYTGGGEKAIGIAKLEIRGL